MMDIQEIMQRERQRETERFKEFMLRLCPWLNFQITVPSEDRRDEEKIYHKISISDLQNMAPFVCLISSLI